MLHCQQFMDRLTENQTDKMEKPQGGKRTNTHTTKYTCAPMLQLRKTFRHFDRDQMMDFNQPKITLNMFACWYFLGAFQIGFL